MPNDLERAALRDPRAAAAARRREQDDPFAAARRRVRELHAPPSAILAVEAVAQQYVRSGRREHVHLGIGDGTEAERRNRRRRPIGQPRHPGRNPTMTEITGMSRRSMFRAKRWIAEHDVLSCESGGPPDPETGRPQTRTVVVPVGHRGRDRSTATGTRTYVVGVGGCAEGGRGWASTWWPFGAAAPPPRAVRRRPTTDGLERIGGGRLGQLVDQVRAQRSASTPPATRGP